MSAKPDHVSESCDILSLSRAPVGGDFEIQGVDGPACDELRKLGFSETVAVRKLANGRNMICSVCGARIAVSRKLADQVKVSPVDS